jgi:hypothetical protein
MMLMIRESEPKSVFRLNGADENSATSALGWVLQPSPNFRLAMVSAWMGEAVDANDVVITLQKHGSDGGYPPKTRKTLSANFWDGTLA